MLRKILVYDSTLRDGEQSEGISFSVEDKISIVKALDRIGIHYIEAGDPASNPKDMELFKKLRNIELKNSKICAFGSTRKIGNDVKSDAGMRALLDSGAEVVTIFGKSWDLHVTKVLNTTLEENLSLIKDSVSFLKAAERYVIFDAEHFFDGCKNNAEYAFKTLSAAKEAGADELCLCDTNGGCLPGEIYEITKKAVGFFGNCIAVHCHNDTGLAVANSLAGVEAGASQVQGTFIGFGERCGNAPLTTVIPDLQLKCGCRCIKSDSIKLLTKTAREIAEISNMELPAFMPYVGSCAFAHKGGMHIDGVKKVSRSFEHVRPASIGNSRRYLLSELSGRASVLPQINKIDPQLKKNSPEVKNIVKRIKELEYQGYQFEGAEASVNLLIRKSLQQYKPFFTLKNFDIIDKHAENSEYTATSIIEIEVGGETELTAANGKGPIDALSSALRKALNTFYPQIKNTRLVDYKVRVLSGEATESKVRVLIVTSDGASSWTTIGVSRDIIEASWIALVDSIEYKLLYPGEDN